MRGDLARPNRTGRETLLWYSSALRHARSWDHYERMAVGFNVAKRCNKGEPCSYILAARTHPPDSVWRHVKTDTQKSIRSLHKHFSGMRRIYDVLWLSLPRVTCSSLSAQTQSAF